MDRKHKKFRLRREADGSLTLLRSSGGRTKDVRLALLNPLQRVGRWYEIQDHEGKSLALFHDPSRLEKSTRQIIEQDVAERYVIPRIRKIFSLRIESSVSYWLVNTDRGRRDFVLREKLDNILPDGQGGYVIKDVMGNYFSVENPSALDGRSRRLLGQVI